jgi:hypothetical protein
MKILSQDIFAINQHARPRIQLIGNCKNILVVVDNFFENPELVREHALSTTYFDEQTLCKLGAHDETTKWYTHHLESNTDHFTDYFLKLKYHFFKDIRYHYDSMPHSYTYQTYTDVTGLKPHVDASNYAGLVCLNYDEEIGESISGTGFFRVRESNQEYVPSGTYRSGRYVNFSPNQFERYHVEHHKFNTLIFYEGSLLHTAIRTNWKSKVQRTTFNCFIW